MTASLITTFLFWFSQWKFFCWELLYRPLWRFHSDWRQMKAVVMREAEGSLQSSENWPLIGQRCQILASYWITSSALRNCHDKRKKFFLYQTVKWKVNLRWFRNKVYGDNLLRFISTRADCFVRKLPEKQLENLSYLGGKKVSLQKSGLSIYFFIFETLHPSFVWVKSLESSQNSLDSGQNQNWKLQH